MRWAPVAALALVASSARAFCPCYTLSSSENTYNCGVEAAPGTNPTVAEWQAIFSRVAKGPSVWGSDGPAVSDIGQGCGLPEALHSVPARFPCELVKAITWRESTWRQFCVPDRPSDQVGGASRTIISFDCGYGVGQVTSGMHQGESPAFDRARVANDATYNLAAGMQILAQKWKATRCVGDNQPKLVEHWYSATWAYNGLAYSNNPTNPAYSTTRGVYDPNVGGSTPYQEKVFGAMEHPPSAAHWPSLAAAYPKLSEIGGAGSPNALSEPSCASPTSCASTRPVHVSACFDDEAPPDAGVEPPDAGPDARDGGAVDSDAGTATPDAGAAPALAMESLGPREGCGCGASPAGALAWLVLLAWPLARKALAMRGGSSRLRRR